MPDTAALSPDAELAALLPALLGLGDAEDAARHVDRVERALALAGSHGRAAGVDGGVEARLRLLHARALGQLCRFEQAYEGALEAEAMLRRAGDARQALRAIVVSSAVCLNTCDYVGAARHATRGLEEARASGDVWAQLRLLSHQTIASCGVEEFDASVAFGEAAVRLAAAHAEQGEECDFAVALLASVRTYRAEALDDAGRADEAAAERRRAGEGLPRVGADTHFRLLNVVLHTLARVGHLDAAHEAARHYVRLVRSLPRGHVWLSHYDMTMGAYHVAAGRLDRASRSMRRALVKMHEAGRVNHLLQAVRQLASLQARAGDHAGALELLREARALRERVNLEQFRLQYRMTAVQRQVEARLVERRTELQHKERLAVIGRLMSQIYHSLEAPLDEVRASLQRCIDGFAEMSTEDLARALGSVIANVDEAARLARQLKMFSYRTAPQQMAISLAKALQDAWQGIRDADAEGGAVSAPVLPCGDIASEVRGDAQRLAVLLRILLIEIERMAGPAAPRLLLSAREGCVNVLFETRPMPGAELMPPGVGFTLCEEIAREMDGTLRRVRSTPGELQIELELPAQY